MAYSFYQAYPGYNPMYYSQLQNMQQPQQNTQQTTQIQNGGFVMVKDISEALNYPVAPGNSVTFKNENQPYIYTKTLGFSQLDQPIFEVFKLIKEDKPQLKFDESDQENTVMPTVEYLSLEEAEIMRSEMAQMRSEIDFLREAIDLYTKDEKEAE